MIHVLTPGDHYSPSTGSATATVVDGLCASRPRGEPMPRVAVARGTFADRYTSADAIEYDEHRMHRWSRYTDAASSRLGVPRMSARRRYRAAVSGQRRWAPHVIVGHNAVQLIPEVDTTRHRVVLYAHNELLNSYSQRETGRVLDQAEAIVVVSAYLAERFAARVPTGLRARIHVVHNGVDLRLFQPSTREPDGVLRVVFVGRVIPDKGVDVLVDAVRRLGRDDIVLTVIGSAGFDAGLPLTRYEREVRAQAAGVEAIRFLPFTPRAALASALQDADVVVVPSRWPEPFALTTLEGMASGAAVIASDIGGIPETVGGVGMLVPAGDPSALASSLEALADDAELLHDTRERCLAFARSHGWDVASAEFHRLIRGATP